MMSSINIFITNNFDHLQTKSSYIFFNLNKMKEDIQIQSQNTKFKRHKI
jgi:hypothetical protein